jgi:hypothetical protein
MDEAIEAFQAFAADEYARIVDTFTNRDERANRRGNMMFEHRAEEGVLVLPGRPPDADEAWFVAHAASKDEHAPRTLYAVTHHTAKDGEVYSFYVSNTEKERRNCNARFRGIFKDGKLRLVGRDHYNRTQGWEHRQGSKASALPQPVETRVLEEPKDPAALDFAR